ncbi:hypothetical protein [Halococcus hamelinensis]|uniref:Uncharacterized protein n=1 Tax=Halococcus hamelinensis 100A6 TaxID=1132509 RepID=M0M056_9EURY|nr:hypothetical protein [Halococcus hamelinensis]EMA37765.1 hypothetical protein C447_12355 [Halococcus hamelinensis 100A6]
MFGLTNALTVVGYLLRDRIRLSTLFLVVSFGLVSIIPVYGLALGSLKRRTGLALALVVSWGLFFVGDRADLLGGAGLLVCVALVVHETVQRGELDFSMYFMQTGAVMVSVMVGVGVFILFNGAVPWFGVWVLWKWSTFVLSIGGFGL